MKIMDNNTHCNGEKEESLKVVAQFCSYLDKSKQLFNGLRDLPHCGHTQWQAYFGRTFDVYTRLWKYQQQNRQILDSVYSLKRWQIGEIASKIGQLYYHYYLRTSDINFLNESYSFYAAIRKRCYYSSANIEFDPDLMTKKLRFYARYIIVCLLLKNNKLVKDLVRELGKHVEEYANTYEVSDHIEWRLVLEEIENFVEANNAIHVINDDGETVSFSYRLPASVCAQPEQNERLSLQEIVIVGNTSNQLKFSELSIDMYRILHSFEKESRRPATSKLVDVSPMTTNIFSASTNCNPHKYLLYQPSFAQLLNFLSSGFKELPSNGIMLLYLSADGCVPEQDGQGDDYVSGLMMNSQLEQTEGKVVTEKAHCLFPVDLCSYTRKPFFLVVDSSNSTSFKHMKSQFDEYFICLMSPIEFPAAFQGTSRKGNLFTLFLFSPLTAFAMISGMLASISYDLWKQALCLVDSLFATELTRILTRSQTIDKSFIKFFTEDEFLKTLITRYVFCNITLRLHQAFQGETMYPSSNPVIPQRDILESDSLKKIVYELADLFDVRQIYTKPLDLDII